MRIPVVTLIVVMLLSVFVDLYIWRDIRKGKSLRRWMWSEIYAGTSILLWIFLIVTVCLPRRSADNGIIHIMWMLTAYASIYIAKIIYIFFSFIGRIPTIFRCRRWLWTRAVGVVAAVAALGFLWFGILYTRYQSQTIDVTLKSSRLPKAFDGYRIAQISDLHLGTWGNDTRFIDSLVRQVNALNPDLIVFTGDIVNQKSDELKPFITSLSRLKAKDGVYSILGNHDYGDYIDWSSPDLKKENLETLKVLQEKSGWKMLNNRHVFISRHSIAHSDSITLIGVENWGEPPFKKYGSLKTACSTPDSLSLKDSNFKILLTHNPEHWLREVRKVSNIDLTLSGHTHALQMSADAFGHRWSPSALRYTTWGGFYTSTPDGNLEDFGNPSVRSMTRNLDRPSLYVNIGAGEVGMPFRIGSCYPEITLITLKRK